MGFVLWLTGLPCSGKTTIARILERWFREKGYKVEVLDGDELRRNLDPELGFSREDRAVHIRRVAYVAKLLSRNDVITIVSLVSPYIEVRRKAREIVGENFVEVYVKVSLDTAIKRDVKGMYKRALAGEIKNFTGIGDKYEPPEDPEVMVDTDVETPEESASKIYNYLLKRGLIRD